MRIPVFICAQPADGRLAEALRHALEGPELDVFYPDVDLRPGDLVDRTVQAKLDGALFVVVLLTNNWPLPDTHDATPDHDTPELVQRAVARLRDNSVVIIPVQLGDVDRRRVPLGLHRITPLRCMSDDMSDAAEHIRVCFLDRTARAVESSPERPSNASSVAAPGAFDLLVDNWLLQDVGDVLNEGLSDGESRVWTPRGPTMTRSALLEVEGLAHFLGALVMYDRLALDRKFVNAWTLRSPAALVSLEQSGVVHPVDFSELPELPALRATYVDLICVTKQLLSVQAENERAWARDRKVVHRVASQVIWGGAGYLARAELRALPYQGHPARMRLLNRGIFAPVAARDQATDEFLEWLAKKRSAARGYGTSRSAPPQVVLPAFLCEVVAASASAADLLPVALQLRDHYAPLRQWLATYERALYEGDPLRGARHRRDLDDAWSDVCRLLKGGRAGNQTLAQPRRAACTSPGRPAAGTLVQRLVLAPSGLAQLDKLLNLLGMTPSAQRSAVRSALVRRWSRSDAGSERR